MNTVHPYADYTIQRKDGGKVVYSESALYPELTVRCFYRIVRIPSTKTLIVYTFIDANDQEREWVENALERGNIGRIFRQWENAGFTHRRRRKDGTYQFSATGGGALDDPLIDLELEMMLGDLLTFEQVAEAYPKMPVAYLFAVGWTEELPSKTFLFSRRAIDAYIAEQAHA